MKLVLIGLLCLSFPFTAAAINVGTLTFAMDQDRSFTAKRVLNNNRSARLYQVSIRAIDRPGEREVRSRPADGELLFAPRQLTLQAGQAEYYKFSTEGRRIIASVITGYHFAKCRPDCSSRGRVGAPASTWSRSW